MRTQMKAWVLAAAMVLVGPAMAETTWTLHTPAYGGTGTLSGDIFSVTGSDGVTTVKITGYANTGSSGALQQQIAVGSIGINEYSGGLGLKNSAACTTTGCNDFNEGTDPEHSFDNNQRIDLMLVDFGSKQVNLTGVGTGWISNDGDITVFAYTGSGAPTLPDGSTLSGLPTGWEAIGNYSDLNRRAGGNADISAQTRPNPADPTTFKYSSLWLIGAYTSAGGSSCYTSGSQYDNGCTRYRDYLKFDFLAGSLKSPSGGGSAPEPGSLALFGLALGALLLLSRRREC